MSDAEVDIVLCIPGPWADRSELIQSLVENNSGYIFAGMIMMQLETKQICELEFCAPDERMASAFQAAGRHWRHTAQMQLIPAHKSVCYLIAKGGTIEAAHSIMHAANALLTAGGYGVKVESSGLAHPPEDWQEQCEYQYLFKSHTSFVVYVTAESTYSCGMHNFGLPDAIVDNRDCDDPGELLRVFTLYLLSETPVIKDGQTFCVDADSPVYRIHAHPPIYYGEDSLFNNPFGTWSLRAC